MNVKSGIHAGYEVFKSAKCIVADNKDKAFPVARVVACDTPYLYAVAGREVGASGWKNASFIA